MTRFRIATLLVLALLIAGPSLAVRRALLVGIDRYKPDGVESRGRGWTNLEGAVRDVEAVREILLARYGFEPANVALLTDQEASRENIIRAIENQLVEPTENGDVAFFYYAGHGSQVANSSSDELDRMDETIVPADSFAGAWDIRDKKLKSLFNDIIDRGGLVTAFFDSCNSGSIARGLPRPSPTRFIQPDPRDIARQVALEAPDSRDPPEQRGALIFSAAQPWQLAAEIRDEEGRRRGAFSLEIQRILRSAPFEASAEEIFLRARAGLSSSGIFQEPVLAGPPARRLFGPASSGNDGRILVAVIRSQGELLRLQGGRAIGLSPGSELAKVGIGDESAVLVRVVEVEGLASARVEVSRGDPEEVRSGDLFTPVNWVEPDEAQLEIWHPPAKLSPRELRVTAAALGGVAATAAVEWVEDPTVTTPTHVLGWSGESWSLSFPDGRMLSLGRSVTVSALLTALGEVVTEAVRLFVYYPPPPGLAAGLGLTAGGAVEPAETIERAHYLLVGRAVEGVLEYSLVLPNLTQEDRAAGFSPLPARSDWLPIAEEGRATGQRLQRIARTLGRIRGWLRLEPPPESSGFPYQLALQNVDTGEILGDGTVRDGERYRLVLRAGERELNRALEQGFDGRYVYLFAIDSFGKRTLLFPPSGQGNAGNWIGSAERRSELEPMLPVGGTFLIRPPFGIDTFVLLTSREPIPNPDVLAGAGVRSRGRGASSPLERLVSRLDEGTRGVGAPMPLTWSIGRLSVRSVP
jgi:hypothetical protein